MIEVVNGHLLSADKKALVNTANTIDVMGSLTRGGSRGRMFRFSPTSSWKRSGGCSAELLHCYLVGP